jgi:hypothetical protein
MSSNSETLESLVENLTKLIDNHPSNVYLTEWSEQLILLVGLPMTGKVKFAQFFSGTETNNNITKPTSQSRIFFPNLLRADKMSFVLYDFGVENERKSSSEDMADAYLIQKILSKAKKVKIVFCVTKVQLLWRKQQLAEALQFFLKEHFQSNIGSVGLAKFDFDKFEKCSKTDQVYPNFELVWTIKVCSLEGPDNDNKNRTKTFMYDNLQFAALKPSQLAIQVSQVTADVVAKLFENFFEKVSTFASMLCNYIAPDDNYESGVDL